MDDEPDLLAPQTRLVRASQPGQVGCPNYPNSLRMFSWPAPNRGSSSLYRLYQWCWQTRIQECHREECIQERKKIQKHLARSNYTCRSFEEWVLVRTSCFIASGVKFSHTDYHDGTIDFLPSVVQDDERLIGLTVDVYELIEFLYDTEFYMEWFHMRSRDSKPNKLEDGLTNCGPWEPMDVYKWENLQPHNRHIFKTPSFHIYSPKISSAIKEASSLGICKNRLWNIVMGSARQEYDIIGLVASIKSANEPSRFIHCEPTMFQPINSLSQADKSHADCTIDLCHFASMDSTKVRGLHKCSDIHNCKPLQYPSDPFAGSGPYIWSTKLKNGKLQHSNGSDYTAISHVWSDGTGAPNGDPPNCCLFKYFGEIVASLGSDAIWWDAISIPKEPKARAAELKTMHVIFQKAGRTVVHDLYLTQIPWSEDGTPCIALALSPWFSRGWTALELIMSRPVAVVFQDPDNPKGFDLRNLNSEILAQNPIYHDRGHWIISNIIGRLRVWHQRIDNIQNLVHLIKTRATSWPRDRLIIAALLCGLTPDVMANNMLAVTTEQILKYFSRIPPTFLFHGCPTNAETGLFSWCPSSLLEFGKLSQFKKLGNAMNIQDSRHEGLLAVGLDGTLTGKFLTRTLDETEISHLNSVSTHPWQDCRVQNALERWDYCVVLWPYYFSRFSNVNHYDLAILATLIRARDSPDNRDRFLDCRFVGAITGAREPKSPNSKTVCFGNTSEEPFEPASKIMMRYDGGPGFQF